MIMPGLSLRSWATLLSVALVVAVVRIEEGRVARARQQAGEYALQAANAHAEGDTTRRVDDLNARVARVLGDSLRLVERLAVQQAQRRDELDHALRRERLARYAMTVRAESLAMVAQAVTEAETADASSSIRRTSFRIRQAPYTIAADVALSGAPDTGTMSIHVALDTLRLETRIGCAASNAAGLREATVSVTGPRWASVRFDRVEQSPDLCGSPALARERRTSPWLAIALGAGAVLDRHGRVSWGLLVGVAYAVKR
jgi:hypothetical protein